MKKGALWRISVSTTAESEEIVSDLLSEVFGEPVASFTHATTGETTVEAYLSHKLAHIERSLRQLRGRLEQLRAEAQLSGTGRMTFRELARQDWAESWKRHFPPLEIGRTLLLRPSWSHDARAKGRIVVVLDPGLSFGTGHHPTTGFCLQQLVRFGHAGRPQAFLDAGTGSGVLAIAAAKLGYGPVIAFDFDPEAVRFAKANARRNRVGRRIRFYQHDLAAQKPWKQRQFALVCANLTADLLVNQRERLCSWVLPGGLLVLAGILHSEFEGLRKHYENAGAGLITSRRRGEWRSGSFRLPEMD
jgi:ribosomal protein L11 methyltransferase